MKTNFDITNKLLLITGCTSGIGLSFLNKIAKKKVKIAIVGRSEESLKSLKNKIIKTNKKIEYFVYDLSENFDSDELIERIHNRIKSNIDIFINSAATATLGKIDDIPIKLYEEAMKVNFYSPLKITKSLLNSMKKNNSGQLIFINSGAEKRGLPYSSVYSVGKAALSVYIESLRVELYQYDIDVISIYPGRIKTNLMFKNKSYGNFSFYDTKKSRNPEVVADAIIRASNNRKSYIFLSKITLIGVVAALILPKLFDKFLKSKINKNK